MLRRIVERAWNNAGKDDESIYHKCYTIAISKEERYPSKALMPCILRELNREQEIDQMFIEKVVKLLSKVLNEDESLRDVDRKKSEILGEKFLVGVEELEGNICNEVEFQLLKELTMMMEVHQNELQEEYEELEKLLLEDD